MNPLEMTSSSFFNESIEENPNLATPYDLDPKSETGRLRPIEYPEKKFISAAGGLFSSINDMLNYVKMQLNKGRYKGTQIIDEKLVDQMQSIQFEESYPNSSFSNTYGNYGRTGYGYGLVIHEDFFGTKLIQHSGSFYGASAWMALLPEKKLGVVFLSNKHPSPRMLAQTVLLELLGLDSQENHPLMKLRKHNKLLSGKYETYKSTLKWEVISKEGGLFIKYQNPKLPLAPLYPIDGNENNFTTLDYYIPSDIGGRQPVQFELDNNEQVWMHYERLKFKKVKE
jgi:CubicO group peptidase (beta-lactamase class C family)